MRGRENGGCFPPPPPRAALPRLGAGGDHGATFPGGAAAASPSAGAESPGGGSFSLGAFPPVWPRCPLLPPGVFPPKSWRCGWEGPSCRGHGAPGRFGASAVPSRVVWGTALGPSVHWLLPAYPASQTREPFPCPSRVSVVTLLAVTE